MESGGRIFFNSSDNSKIFMYLFDTKNPADICFTLPYSERCVSRSPIFTIQKHNIWTVLPGLASTRK